MLSNIVNREKGGEKAGLWDVNENFSAFRALVPL